MKIAVLGLGYVGMTAAACLASQGHQVIGVDPSENKVSTVLSGKSPITEPMLDEMIAEAVSRGTLTARTHLDGSVAECELAIVCVGTPSAPDGSHNMSYIAEVSRQLAEMMKSVPGSKMVVAYRSTCKPGTMEDLVAPIFADVLDAEASDRVELVYNPEFLRESVAVKDYFAPPKIVVGTKDGAPCGPIDKINEGITAPIFYVKYREAEITKFVDNTFHAVKTAFANEIGRVCTKLGISAQAIHEIFVSDTKLNVSPYYLRPGGPFGGSCLPKDVRALQYMSRMIGGQTALVDSLLISNEAHKNFIVEHCTSSLPHGASILMLGLAFKDKSDDLRESPNIDIARQLLTAGYDLSIFDPHVNPSNLVGQNLGVFSNSTFLRKLLVDKDVVESKSFDLVIDTRSVAHLYYLKSDNVIDVNALA